MADQENKKPFPPRRAVGRKVWRSLSKLPFFIRGAIVRNMFSATTADCKEYIFKQADTLDEIQQALELVFEAYHEKGLVNELESKLRTTKYHMMPTTSILICKKGEKVIATISVIIDTGLGLPIDKTWNISKLRSKSARIAEVASLAIKSGYRTQRGRILLSLCSYMFRHSQNQGIDRYVASYHPDVQDFYRCVLLFSKVGHAAVSYNPGVQSAEAVGGTLCLSNAKQLYKKVYSRKKGGKNLYQLFFGPAPENFIFDKQHLNICSNFVFTPENLRTLFREKTDIVSKLSRHETSVITEALFQRDFKNVFLFSPLYSERKAARFAVNLQGTIKNKNESVQVLEISRNGAKINLTVNPYKVGDTFTLNCVLPNGTTADLSCTVVWISSTTNQLGLEIDHSSIFQWTEMINTLEAALQKATASKQQEL